MKIIYISLCVFAYLQTSCGTKPGPSATVPATENLALDTIRQTGSTGHENSSTIDEKYIQIIESADHTFGYLIDKDGMKIRQTTIPSLPGNKGFRTKDDALKVARLVVYKIDNKMIPPSVTTVELDSLGVK